MTSVKIGDFHKNLLLPLEPSSTLEDELLIRYVIQGSDAMTQLGRLLGHHIGSFPGISFLREPTCAQRNEYVNRECGSMGFGSFRRDVPAVSFHLPLRSVHGEYGIDDASYTCPMYPFAGGRRKSLR